MLPAFLPWLIVYFTTEWAITNRRVLAKRGLIKREAVELRLDRVEPVFVMQTILGCLFNYVMLIISGADASAPFSYIDSPIQFKNMLNHHLDGLEEGNQSITGSTLNFWLSCSTRPILSCCKNQWDSCVGLGYSFSYITKLKLSSGCYQITYGKVSPCLFTRTGVPRWLHTGLL